MGRRGMSAANNREFVMKRISQADKHVGNRVRIARLSRGFSQEKLGEALGISFQQVQKYEKGINRVSTGRLQQIATILELPTSYFFDGLPSTADGKAPAYDPASVAGATPDGMALIKAFNAITDTGLRRSIVGITEAAAKAMAA